MKNYIPHMLLGAVQDLNISEDNPIKQSIGLGLHVWSNPRLHPDFYIGSDQNQCHGLLSFANLWKITTQYYLLLRHNGYVFGKLG